MVFHFGGPRGSQQGQTPTIQPAIRRLLIGAGVLLAGSCASHVTIPPSSAVSLVVESCQHISLSARLFDVQGDLHVHGTVRPRVRFSAAPAYVDVKVRNAGGEVWAQTSAYYRLPHRPRIGPGPAFMSLTLEGLPPPGSIVEVRHHHASVLQLGVSGPPVVRPSWSTPGGG